MIGVVLGVLAFDGIQNALFLTNFNQEATGVVIGLLLLVSVFVPNMAAFSSRGRQLLARRRRTWPMSQAPAGGTDAGP